MSGTTLECTSAAEIADLFRVSRASVYGYSNWASEGQVIMITGAGRGKSIEQQLSAGLAGSALAGCPQPTPRQMERLRAILEGRMSGDEARAEARAEREG